MLDPNLMMAQIVPWFENPGSTFGVLGAAVGVLGAILGVGLATCAPRGIGKSAIFTFQIIIALAGIMMLAAGLVAVTEGQPYAVWYPLLLIGTLTTGIFGGLIPATKIAYRQAEQRKLEAEEFRTG